MRVEKTRWGTIRWFARGSNHSAAFIHIDRYQTMLIPDSDSIDHTVYIEKGICEVTLEHSTMIIQEGSNIHVPLGICVCIEAKFGDVDLIRICSIVKEDS